MFELIDQLISYRTVHRVKEFFTACLMRILVRNVFGYVFYCRASESRVQFASGAYLIVDTVLVQFVILYLREQFVLVGSVP
jgi:hypothetical protein